MGEVLRIMAPLAGEVRRTRVWGLTDKGRDVARQLLIGETKSEPAVELLRSLENRPLSETTILRKFVDGSKLIKSLERKGFLEVEQSYIDRDPAAGSRRTPPSAIPGPPRRR